MHVAEAEAKDKAHQEGTGPLILFTVSRSLTSHIAAAAMEEMHIVNEQAKDKADQEGSWTLTTHPHTLRFQVL